MPKARLPLLCAALLLLALPVATQVAAEVVDSGPGGFTSVNTAAVEAAPAEVWSALVDDVGEWWSSAHSFSMDAGNMSIDARPMGCFCEALPDGGGVRHLTVVAVMPGKMLRMTGGLGPLQGRAVRGAMTWEMAASDEGAGEGAGEGEGGTSVRLTYAVHGYAPQGLESWAGPVDGVVGEALERLARFVDSGNPEPAGEGGPGTDTPDGEGSAGGQD